jgi:hypothetical protein
MLCGFAFWCLVYFISIAQMWVPSFLDKSYTIYGLHHNSLLYYALVDIILLDNVTSINVGVRECFHLHITHSSFLHPAVELLNNMLDKLLVFKEILLLLYKACILIHIPINMNEGSTFCYPLTVFVNFWQLYWDNMILYSCFLCFLDWFSKGIYTYLDK